MGAFRGFSTVRDFGEAVGIDLRRRAVDDEFRVSGLHFEAVVGGEHLLFAFDLLFGISGHVDEHFGVFRLGDDGDAVGSGTVVRSSRRSGEKGADNYDEYDDRHGYRNGEGNQAVAACGAFVAHHS